MVAGASSDHCLLHDDDLLAQLGDAASAVSTAPKRIWHCSPTITSPQTVALGAT
jgi:hypothetical protein